MATKSLRAHPDFKGVGISGLLITGTGLQKVHRW